MVVADVIEDILRHSTCSPVHEALVYPSPSRDRLRVCRRPPSRSRTKKCLVNRGRVLSNALRADLRRLTPCSLDGHSVGEPPKCEIGHGPPASGSQLRRRGTNRIIARAWAVQQPPRAQYRLSSQQQPVQRRHRRRAVPGRRRVARSGRSWRVSYVRAGRAPGRR